MVKGALWFFRVSHCHWIRNGGYIGIRLNSTQASSSDSVRVRFAPSPTGFVHIGGLRTIVCNWMFARSHPTGQFILRIEDTDQDRVVKGAAEALESTLAWLGMEPDESPLKGGPFGPYVQSQRLQLYKEAAQTLLEKGRAYRCFCTAQRLMLMKKEALKNRESISYDNRCRSLTPAEIDEKLGWGVPYAIRLHLENAAYPHADMVYGPYEYRVDVHEGDPVIIKSDSFPTYHLANVVDDHFMRITHVIRGEEWLQSTPKHLQLYTALGWSPPRFGHLPIMKGVKGGKLSKRDSAANLDMYKERGYYPVPLINFVLSTGGGFDQKEKNKNILYTVHELQSMFNLEKLSTKPTKMEPDYLDKYNTQYMKICSRGTLLNDLKRLIPSKLDGSEKESTVVRERLDDEYLGRILDTYLSEGRNPTLVSLLESTDTTFLWSYDLSPHPDLLKPVSADGTTVTTPDIIALLEKLINKLETGLPAEFNEKDAKQFMADFEEESNISHHLLFPFIRLLFTNNRRGLPIAAMFYLLGKERIVQRLKRGVDELKRIVKGDKQPMRSG